MITRIEIDGFKSFADFTLNVPPFLALVGANGAGKSNLFDALRLVADVVEHGAEEALLNAERGNTLELFRRMDTERRADRIRIVLGLIVSSPAGPLAMRCRIVLRRYGTKAKLDGGSAWVSSLRDRSWMTELGLPPESAAILERSRADFERAQATGDTRAPGPSELRWSDLGRTPWDDFRSSTWSGLGRGGAVVRQLLAHECHGWQPLTLDPRSMRDPAQASDERPLLPSGENLAAVLARLHEQGEAIEVLADVAAMVQDTVGLHPVFDERRQERDFDLEFRRAGRMPPRLLSDGTLRILAIFAALYDPAATSTLLIEEIENGLHPSRLADFLRRIQQHVTDYRDPKGLLRATRQILVTSHSPVLVSALPQNRLVFLDTVSRVDPNTRAVSAITRARPVAADGERGTYVSKREVRQYLASVQQAVG